jgi:hypothetical protein
MKKLLALAVLGFVLCAVSYAAPLGPNEAYVLLGGLALWQDQPGGALKWAENLTLGDRVTLLNRTAKFKQDGKERDFVRVRATDGQEGWVRPPYVASKASLAVVSADGAVIYSEPRDVKITSRTISRMTLVAVLQDGGSGNFAKVQGFDVPQNTLLGDSTFVAMEDLTSADADVNAVILYSVASATKNQDVRKNLLKVITNKYGSSLFLPKIQADLGGGAVAARPTAPFSGQFAVIDDNVNVRAAPDEKNGQVVGRLDRDAVVDVVEKTTESYTIGDQTAPWYRIKDPAGWVFGSFLEAQ